MNDFHPIDDTHGPGCPARFELGFCDEVTVRYSPKSLCDWCGKREDDMSVQMDGKIVGLCSVCFERTDYGDRREDDSDDD